MAQVKPRVTWLRSASEDAVRLFYFLDDKDKKAAKRMLKLLEERAEFLISSPRVGMPVGDDRRELYIPFGAGYYVLTYMLDVEGNPVIIRVWHSRQDRNPV